VAGNDVLMSPSPTGELPGWLRARPHLLAGTLRWSNIHRRYKFLLPVSIALLLAVAAFLTLPIAGRLLDEAAQNPFSLFASLGAACAIATAHRRAHIRQSLADSWLAPLSAPASVFLRMILPPLLQVFLLMLAVAIPLAAGTLGWEGAKTVGLIVVSAFLVGSLIGWFSHGDKTASAPAFHYATVRKPRENWARAPRLDPLSYWAIAQARVVSKPKVAAKIFLLVLLALPMGSSSLIGQEALAIAAAGWVLLQMVSLFIGTVSVAFEAARWLAPTAIRYGQFVRMLGYRVLLAQLWVWSWVVFLCYAAALPGALRIGLRLALLFLFLSCAVTVVTSWIAMRRSR
jgi:hypothetical protein